jgi:hypothetical protein
MHLHPRRNSVRSAAALALVGCLAIPSSFLGGPAATADPLTTNTVTTNTALYAHAAQAGDALSAAGPATVYGSLRGQALASPIVGMRASADGGGYWLVAADGTVYGYGDAKNLGSLAGTHLNAPIVGIASTPDGGGYWLVSSDGGIFAFGDAQFHGSTGALHLNAPIVGMAATSTGGGYWLVASDGGIFAFGDAQFHGSTGALHLDAPIVGIASTPDAGGYWLVASDGGIFAFGNASFHGSAGGQAHSAPITGIAATADGAGYWLVDARGDIYSYGDAFAGSAQSQSSSVVGIASGPAATGFWTVAANGGVTAGAPGSVAASAASGAPATLSATPATLMGVTTEHTFLVPGANGAAPARWNPCQPITYAVNVSDAPAGWQADLDAALGQVATATGISFTYEGTTTAVPSVNTPPTGDDAVIGWVTSAQAPKLVDGPDGVVGYGGGYYINSAQGPLEFVGGYVAINGAAVGSGANQVRPGGGVGLTDVQLLLHELGHMMGLNHVTNPYEVMYPDINPQSQGQYEAGDLGGLAQLGTGAGGCLTP